MSLSPAMHTEDRGPSHACGLHRLCLQHHLDQRHLATVNAHLVQVLDVGLPASAHHQPGDLGLQHLTRTPGWGRPLCEPAHQFTLLVQDLSIDDLHPAAPAQSGQSLVQRIGRPGSSRKAQIDVGLPQ